MPGKSGIDRRRFLKAAGAATASGVLLGPAAAFGTSSVTSPSARTSAPDESTSPLFGAVLSVVVDIRKDGIVVDPAPLGEMYAAIPPQVVQLSPTTTYSGALDRPMQAPVLLDNIVAFGEWDVGRTALTATRVQVNYLQVIGQITEADATGLVVRDASGVSRRCVYPATPALSELELDGGPGRSLLEPQDRVQQIPAESVTGRLRDRLRWAACIEGEGQADAVDNIIAWSIAITPPQFASGDKTTFEMAWKP